MPQKSPAKKTGSPKAMQFHQVVDTIQQMKTSSNNQRMLILSTPIKLKDGTVNIEQRAIPLRIDNNKLTLAGVVNNNVIPVKLNNEQPQPLALPLHQLNKQLPTFVKNEVGQVMGKLIPLGKFSNIPLPAAPLVTTPIDAPTSPPIITQSSLSKILQQNPKRLETKESKPMEDTKKIIIKENSSMTVSLKSTTKLIQSATSTLISSGKSSAVTSSMSSKSRETAIATAKPKKQVHLVLKGDKNIASIGQTGRNIRLIPLEEWKLGSKSNVLNNISDSTLQSKIVSARNGMEDEITGVNEPLYFDPSKLDCIIEEEDFNMDDILKKDPLSIENLPVEESEMSAGEKIKEKSIVKSDSRTGLDLKLKKNSADVTYSKCSTPEDKRIQKTAEKLVSKISCKTVCSSTINKGKTHPHQLKKNVTTTKENVCNTESNNETEDVEMKTVPSNQSNNSSSESTSEKIEEKETTKGMTSREKSMMSCIQNLRKKLTYQKRRVRMLASLEQIYPKGMAYLTNMQRCFLKCQLRNPRKLAKKRKFTEIDIIVAQEIFRATGSEGYVKLRKLFSLPARSVVTNT